MGPTDQAPSSAHLAYQHAGFLDGGDRTVSVEGQVGSPPSSFDRGATTAFQIPIALNGRFKTANSLSGAQFGPASIVVYNLPAVLFAQDSDLEPLFFPFGEVKEIRRQGPFPATQSRADTISVLVTYSSYTGAKEAKLALHGQSYGDIPLIVESFPPFPRDQSNWKPGRDSFSRSSLNPRASPFILDSTLAVSAPPTCRVTEYFPDYFSKPTSSGLATRLNYLPFPDPVPQGHRSLPSSSRSSRSNSAASWSVPPARSSTYA